MQITSTHTDSRREYSELCSEEIYQYHLFSQPWWLDAACDDSSGWDAVIAKSNKTIIGALPFTYVKTRFGNLIRNLPLCPTLSPLIVAQSQDPIKRRESYRRVLGNLIEALPNKLIFLKTTTPLLSTGRRFIGRTFAKQQDTLID